MSPEEFCVWLSGFATAANPYNITPKQWDDIREKLAMVFEDNHIESETVSTPEWGISAVVPNSFGFDSMVVEYVEKDV